MTLNEFKNWAVAQGTVAKFTDGKYVGECVSLINQYLGRVYGINAGAWGNAKDWANNAEVAKLFDKVSSPQAGDIGVSGATASNPYGHIWVYLSPTQILEQNGKVSRRVSVGSPYIKPIAILRKKGSPSQGDQTMVDQNMLNNLYLAVFGRKPDPSAQGFIGKPADVVLQAMLDAKEETMFEKAARLQKQIDAGLPASDADKKLKQIKEALGI